MVPAGWLKRGSTMKRRRAHSQSLRRIKSFRNAMAGISMCTLPISCNGRKSSRRTAASGNPSFSSVPYVGTVDAQSDLLSGSLVVRFDDVEPGAKKPYMR
jgi:hypothetical protein